MEQKQKLQQQISCNCKSCRGKNTPENSKRTPFENIPMFKSSFKKQKTTSEEGKLAA